MPSERVPNTLKIAIAVLGVIAVGTIVFVFVTMQSAPVEPEAVRENAPVAEEREEVAPAPGPREVPEVSEEGTQVTDVTPEEPQLISEDNQSKIDAVTAKIERGELTLEEAQKEINKLLGI